ncbi:hypothetical protein MPER_05269 [Moniliophthora perniciosa FA553]|nr:hypothetical protein MPER_05269 [Moniliophthora perniciosa FA553]
MGRPNGYETMNDEVFVCPSSSIPKHSASQLRRNGAEVMGATSLKVIQDTCPCGLCNFNPYVGTVPEGERDVLGPDGLTVDFTNGLKVACNPSPSLPATPPETTAASTTITATAAPTSPPV